MPQTEKLEALSMLLTDEGADFLAEQFAGVIDNINKGALSMGLKNTDLSGDPTSGTVTAKRFANAQAQDYGTARAAGAGNKVKSKDVTVAIDKDKEFVEEIEGKDVSLHPVRDVVGRRAANHVQQMITLLDREFFSVAATNATVVEVDATADIADQLEALIQECENTHNAFVDGVDRALMVNVLSTNYYGKVRNSLDKQVRANVDTADESFYTWHGVETASCTRLPSDYEAILMVRGAVAQPVMADQYTAEKIPLSKAIGIELFFDYGTEAITPDLIFAIKKPAATENTENTENTPGGEG